MNNLSYQRYWPQQLVWDVECSQKGLYDLTREDFPKDLVVAKCRFIELMRRVMDGDLSSPINNIHCTPETVVEVVLKQERVDEDADAMQIDSWLARWALFTLMQINKVKSNSAGNDDERIAENPDDRMSKQEILAALDITEREMELVLAGRSDRQKFFETFTYYVRAQRDYKKSREVK